jgi:hypothetical protein
MSPSKIVSNFNSDQLIVFQLQQLPDSLKKEVLDFIGMLFSKHNLKPAHKNKPKFGSAKGKYKMSSDFDAPLEIFKDYME